MADNPPTEPVEAPEVTPEEQAEIDTIKEQTGNVKGSVDENAPLEEEEAIPEGTPVEEEVPEEEEVAAEETPEKVPEIPPEADETGVYAPPTTVDPGDFKPGDYSFTVQTTDGRTHRITTPEDVDQLAIQLDNSPELISASQFMMLGRKTALMEQGITNDRMAYDQMKEQHDAQAEQAAVRDQYLNQWQGEINYLEGRGELPPVTPALNGADWTDPKVANEPGVKERLAVFKYMEEENNRRMAAGLMPDLSVLTAYKAMLAEAKTAADTADAARTKTTTRARGAMVGKKAPYEPAIVGKGIVGAPRGLTDVATEAHYAAQE